MTTKRRRGDVAGVICYSPEHKVWGCWEGGQCVDTDVMLSPIRDRHPYAEVHVQAELFGPETREAIDRGRT